jgi:hypothetical protein
MPTQVPQGFVPDGFVPDTPLVVPEGFEPDLPTFRTEMERDAQGRPVVRDDWMQRGADALEQGVADFAVGIGKGAVDTVSTLGRLARKIPGVAALDRIVPPVAVSVTPTDTMQSLGKGAERIAEVILPGRAIGRAGVAAADLVAPTLARAVGPTVARAIPRALVEGTGAAGLAAVQGGDPRVAAVLGAAAPAIGEALTGPTVTALRTNAARKVVQALGPTKERFKAMAERLTPEILRRGLSGNRAGLLEQAATTADTVGEQIDEAIQQFGARQVNTAPVVEALETAKDAFRTTTRKSLADLVRSGQADRATNIANGMADVAVEFEPRAIRQLDRLQQIVQELGPDARVDQLIGIRRAWDKVVDQAGGFAHRASGGAIGVPLKDQSEAWAKREATTAIRSLLATEVPELATLNTEYAFWKGLGDVVGQTIKRTAPQGSGLRAQVAEVAGAVAGGHGGLGTAFLTGKIAKAVNNMITSPRFRLADARLRNGLADAIASGSQSQVLSALSRLAAVESSQVPAMSGP